MNNPFRVGDKVYHHREGLVTITKISEGPALIRVEKDKDYWWFPVEMLSFEPWTAPVHKRPFRKGWYIARRGVGLPPDLFRLQEPTEGWELLHYFGETYPTNLKD